MSLLPRPRHLCQLLLVLAICGIPSSAAATETTRAVAAAACSKVKAATGQPPTRLTTALELDVRRDAPSPVATSTVTAHVPADWPEVAALRERLRIARRTKAPYFAEDTQPPEDTERAREQLRGKWPGVGSDEALRQLHTQAVDALGCLFPRGEEHPVFGDERYASQLAVTTRGGIAEVTATSRRALDDLTMSRLGPWSIREVDAELVSSWTPRGSWRMRHGTPSWTSRGPPGSSPPRRRPTTTAAPTSDGAPSTSRPSRRPKRPSPYRG